MKKIVKAVMTFLLLLSITNVNAQQFTNPENRNIFSNNNNNRFRNESFITYRRFGLTTFRINHYREECKRNFYRDRIYYNQPRVDYKHNQVFHYANYHQGTRIGYYYYPSVNVYFSPFTHMYIYQYNGGWVSGDVLPHGIYINEPYSQVYCNVGENIWLYNRAHIETFKRNLVPVERQNFGRPNVARPMFEKRVGNGPRGKGR